MFKKLLKYDLKAVWRLWWIMLPVLPLAGLAGAVAVRFMTSNVLAFSDKVSLQLLSAILSGIMTIILIVCIGTIVLSFALTFILMYYRFYKHLFSDEGYLTFTLPVSRRAILLSKTLNGVIWTLLHGLLAFLSLGIFVVVAIPAEDGALINTEIYAELAEVMGKVLPEVWEQTGAWLIVYAVEYLLIMLVGIVSSVCTIHLCITIGSVIAKKAKLLAAVGIYYGVSILLSLVGQIGVSVIASAMSVGLIDYIDKLINNGTVWGAVALMLLLFIAMEAAMCAVLYCITQWLIDRKLNLA